MRGEIFLSCVKLHSKVRSLSLIYCIVINRKEGLLSLLQPNLGVLYCTEAILKQLKDSTKKKKRGKDH